MMNKQYINYVKIRHWHKLIVASFKNSRCLPPRITLYLHLDLEATLTAHKYSLQESSNSRLMDLLAQTVYYYTYDGVLYVLVFFHDASLQCVQISDQIMFLIRASTSVFHSFYLLPCFISILKTILLLQHCHFLDCNTV